jgi:hypothetical protein
VKRRKYLELTEKYYPDLTAGYARASSSRISLASSASRSAK